MSISAKEDPRTRKELLEEIDQLRGRLGEAEQIIDAIRSGDADALVVTGPDGEQVFSLTGAERTYRLIVETMNEAALTVGLEGTILFCNQRFCDLVNTPMGDSIGRQLPDFFTPDQHPDLRMLLADAQAGPVHVCFKLRTNDGAAVSVQIAASLLVTDALTSICLVVTDLTEVETQTNSIRIMKEHQQVLEASRAELQTANILLSDSRRAALNMMEDAVVAHLELEEVNAHLLREIGERTRAEDELRNAHDELEVRVRERTGELSRVNEQLTQEIDEHKKAEESLQVAYAEIDQLKDRLQAENVYLRQEVARKHNFGEIIGQSSALSYVLFRVEQVAPQDATVLLLGETGTGKGVVASAIHIRSARKNRPMITVNCTSLPANLIEAELFGRERGAFTGAHDRQIGRFELADGGTIFLDEIGDLPLELQSKLLRVIQNGEFERLGSSRTIKVNVRIIAATNRNLEEGIRGGKFREDLFYRLNVFPITMPPLRQRPEDIPLLVNHFVIKFNKKMGRKIETVAKDTMTALQEYHWPGNVRELESVIERAIITSPGIALQVLDRFDTFRKAEPKAGQEVEALIDLELHHIQQVLLKTGWRIEGKNGAALLLGMNPSTLRARMRKFGIRRD
jgi:PAS domain S-box-containing protein